MENRHIVQIVILASLLPFTITWSLFEIGQDRCLRELYGRWSWVPGQLELPEYIVDIGDRLVEVVERMGLYATN